ncbi:MAG: UDP-N-acetylmuramoyl-tripeptide--D-alanyl-D-alanine ligase [Anaerovoracaceae bacterium]|nr:UDP-N-acetylmuramoyl-tripeptide--D-alanyl-D-alanine ligase [Anaerovoracaceae bacterium]
MKRNMKFKLLDCIEAIGGKLTVSEGPDSFEGVFIDSRQVKENSAFFALIGENHDAHCFVEEVMDQGCQTFFLSSQTASDRAANYAKNNNLRINIILVDDTTEAMAKLAEFHLNRIDPKKIAITGSMGKTTTRDMIYAVCSCKYKTGHPIKNYNSLIGVSMTVLAYDMDVEVAVIEIGMESLGEIHHIVEWVKPDISLITYIGLTHLEQLGSQENIYKAKMEITDFLDKDDLLIINQDSPTLNKNTIVGQYDIISVGSSGDCDYKISDCHDHGEKGIDFKLTMAESEETIQVDLPIPGAHNRFNAALAIAAGEAVGISPAESVEALQSLERTGMRMEFKDNGVIRVMDDSYSSFPEAVRSAVDSLASTEARRRVAILAGMNGWADISRKVHMEVGEYVVEKGLDLLICVGQHTDDMASAAFRKARVDGSQCKVIFFSDKSVLINLLPHLIEPEDLVLVKGSRMYAMEEVVERLLGIVAV